MSLNTRAWKPLALTVVLAVLFAACAAPTPQVITNTITETQIVKETVVVPEEVAVTTTPEPFAPKGTLIVALSADINAIEPSYAVENNAGMSSATMFDTLIFPRMDGTVEPALAESWDIGDDGLTYTFHLRKDITFHNGEPFTADSVVFSWQTYQQPDVTYASSWNFASDVEKVDDYTVKVTTPNVDPFFLNEVAIDWNMIPPKYYAEVGKDGFAQHPVGTGPFMFKEWVRGDHFTVEANPNYWRQGYPKIQTIIFKPIPESSTRLSAINTGEADIATRLSSEEAKTLLGEPGVQIIKTPLDRVQYVGFNNMTTGVGTPIESAQVRQAINYAVDRDAIVKTLFDGYAQPLSGLFSTNNPGYNPDEVFAFDPDKAKELLTEAGYPNGFEVGLACPDGAYLNVNETCEAIVGYLADVGITVDLQLREANQHWDLEANKELEPMFFDSWGSSNGEAIQRLQGTLKSGETYANWTDPALDDLIHQAETTIDLQQRTDVYKQIQQKMFDDPPFLYLLQEESFAALTSRVQGYSMYPWEAVYFWNLSLSDEQ